MKDRRENLATEEKPYDIGERTFLFGVRVVRLVGQLPRTVAGYAIGRQIVRAGTSVGANVEEADAAESKRDFIHKMAIARKEAKETRFWLRIILKTPLLDIPEVHALLQEIEELIRILSTIMTFERYGKNRTTGTGVGLTPHYQRQKEHISGEQGCF